MSPIVDWHAASQWAHLTNDDMQTFELRWAEVIQASPDGAPVDAHARAAHRCIVNASGGPHDVSQDFSGLDSHRLSPT
jgi:hypothetical protein